MRTLTFCCVIIILTSGIVTTNADQDTRATVPDGAWEGVIEGAIRPVVIAVEFSSGTAKLDVAGSAALPIENLSNQAGRILFQLKVGAQVLHFEGELRAMEIRGTVRIGERDIGFWLERLPELPAPRDRVEAWQQDLSVMLTRFLRYDRSFSTDARTAFRDRITALQRSLRTKSDQEITVELARAIALGGNAHTRLYLMRNRTEVRRLPIRVWWFKDRLHIVRALNEHTNLLGCRVLRIGALDLASATARIRGIKTGNDSWQRYMSAYFLTSPDLLFGSGVIPDPGHVALTVSCGRGSREVRLSPLPLRKETAPVEAWWDLPFASREANASFVPALRPEIVPRYLRRPQENYWFEYIPEYRAIYLQYNRSQQTPGGGSMKEFTA